jgi:hypothetical protein
LIYTTKSGAILHSLPDLSQPSKVVLAPSSVAENATVLPNLRLSIFNFLFCPYIKKNIDLVFNTFILENKRHSSKDKEHNTEITWTH